ISTLRRLSVALALAGAVCAWTVPQALAVTSPRSAPSATKTLARHFQHEDALYAARRKRRLAVPDAFERYVASHPYGKAAPTPERFRVPLYTPAMLAAHYHHEDLLYRPRPSLPTVGGPAGDRIVDDSFRDAPTVVASPKNGNGLDWRDFGIGAGAMLGLTLIVTGLGLGTLAMRHRTSKLGTP